MSLVSVIPWYTACVNRKLVKMTLNVTNTARVNQKLVQMTPNVAYTARVNQKLVLMTPNVDVHLVIHSSDNVIAKINHDNYTRGGALNQ